MRCISAVPRGHKTKRIGGSKRAVAEPVQQTAALERGLPLHFARDVMRNVFVMNDGEARVLC